MIIVCVYTQHSELTALWLVPICTVFEIHVPDTACIYLTKSRLVIGLTEWCMSVSMTVSVGMVSWESTSSFW